MLNQLLQVQIIFKFNNYLNKYIHRERGREREREREEIIILQLLT